MPSTTLASTTPSAVLQNLQSNYGPQAQTLGHGAAGFYFSILPTLEFLGAFLSIAFLAGTIYFLIQTGWLANRVDRFQDIIMRKDILRKRMRSSWNDIERHFFAGDDNDLKIAIIEADNLLDEALQGVGVQGAQLGDRLKKVRPDQLPNIDDVWQAHKLRNRIAHEANFVMKRDLAERALTVYEKSLENLGMLDAATDTENKPAPAAGSGSAADQNVPPKAKHH